VAMPWEEFFVKKIEQGLGTRVLSDDERQFLLTPVTEAMSGSGFTPAAAQNLQSKAMKALTVAYNEDTQGKNRRAGVLWRDNNKAIYEHSQLVISGIVQNWYLEVGRSLEKRAFGCATAAAVGLVCVLLVALAVAGRL
jgi:hypothetical protein